MTGAALRVVCVCVNVTVFLASSSWDFVRVCCYKLGWSGLACVGVYVWLGGVWGFYGWLFFKRV